LIGEAATGTPLGVRVKTVADQVRELRAEIAAAAEATPGSLLDELCALDEAARNLRAARDAVLVQTRSRGSSWNTISAQTEVAATTWRGRFDRYLEGD
jgi:hypothetical protein